MGSENQVNNLKIYTHAEFDKSPLSNVMSYEQYFNNCIKQNSLYNIPKSFKLTNNNSAFGFGFSTNPLEAKKEAALAYAKEFQDRIKNEIDERVKQKEIAKDEAEKAYYAALEQEKAMKQAQERAYKDMIDKLITFGENSTQYNEYLTKYNLSAKTYFDAEVNSSIAKDHFMGANKDAHYTYFSSLG